MKNTKKLLIWSVIFFCYPFIISTLLWLFGSYTLSIQSPILEAHIERIIDIISNPMVYTVFFFISMILSVIVLIKTKSKNLLAIFLTTMSLLFIYVCFYLYL